MNIAGRFYYHFGLIIILLLPVFDAFEGEIDGPRTEIRHGKIKGRWMYTTTGRQIEAYLGIPYAETPVGKLRFQAPIEQKPWISEIDATVDAPVCVQFGGGIQENNEPNLIGQEDCLYLNVFKPKDLDQEYLAPVLVYIHGGGLVSGSSSIKDFGPQILLNKDIILVTFNYRLDILGFLSTEDKELPGNAGLKDQVAVLRWVRENIKYFGGDPERVTLYGHSSGGVSVHYHMLSPMSKGLFQKAISGSGHIFNSYPAQKGLASERAKKVGDYVKCPTENSAFLLKCLQQLPLNELFKHHDKFRVLNSLPSVLFGPTAELESDEVDENGPFITMKSIKSNTTVPWIIGFVADEGLFAFSELGMSENSDELSDLNRNFNKFIPLFLRFEHHNGIDSELVTNAIKEFYFDGKDVDRPKIPQLAKVASDAFFLFGYLKSLQKHSGDAYYYYFTHRGQYSHTDVVVEKHLPIKYKDEAQSYVLGGVSHGDELQFLFPSMVMMPKRKEVKFNEKDEIVSNQFVKLITDFMTYPDISDQWQKTSLENLEYLHMSTRGFKMEKNLLSDRTQFWSNWLVPKFDEHDYYTKIEL